MRGYMPGVSTFHDLVATPGFVVKMRPLPAGVTLR